MTAVSDVACIGAGPAGLTAAYLLARRGLKVVVCEKDPEYLGGISRTVRHQGFSLDIGGHRFFSKSEQINELWQQMLPSGFQVRHRLSRIYYRGQLFSYPIRPFEVFRKLGPIESTHAVLSYLAARLAPYPNPRNLQEWVSNQFGDRLFRTFFKTYTEKVWGQDCRTISADWAAQRIKGLSLASALRSAIRPWQGRFGKPQAIKTLIERFHYPERGPGMLWEAVGEDIRRHGGRFLMGASAGRFIWDGADALWNIEIEEKPERIRARHFVSSVPLADLVSGLMPRPDPEALCAAGRLRYRDFILVGLMARGTPAFRDQWLYVHDPEVRVGRIQNFASWSEKMVPDPALSCYGLEYFCSEGDDLWRSSNDALVELATEELHRLGLVQRGRIFGGVVVRQPKAYPVYDHDYAENVAKIRRQLSHYPNLHPVGRNGMHRYNNQDHAMMTAMLSVENILAGRQRFDVWRVNQDAEYCEEG
jgi:protoporphyrinogen oxidase